MATAKLMHELNKVVADKDIDDYLRLAWQSEVGRYAVLAE